MTTAADPQTPLVSRHILTAKALPQQERAIATVEHILSTTIDLLAEVGIERLSTNLICKRAGLTPPALYRYFPNKYAILRELGERLMNDQNRLIEVWATPQNMKLPKEAFAQSVLKLFTDTVALTEAQPAGIWIARALRAVPALAVVRVQSHEYISGLIENAMLAAYPKADPQTVKVLSRLAIEIGYAAEEMLFDNPQMDRLKVAHLVTHMITNETMQQRDSW